MSALSITGLLLILIGVVFAVRDVASEKSEVKALRGISLSVSGYVLIIILGAGLVVADRWFQSEDAKIKTTEDRAEATVPPTLPPVEEADDLFPNGFTFGDNNELDRLQRSCERSNWDDCDLLYLLADPGSDYEFVGATCNLPFNPNPDTEWCLPLIFQDIDYPFSLLEE